MICKRETRTHTLKQLNSNSATNNQFLQDTTVSNVLTMCRIQRIVLTPVDRWGLHTLCLSKPMPTSPHNKTLKPINFTLVIRLFPNTLIPMPHQQKIWNIGYQVLDDTLIRSICFSLFKDYNSGIHNRCLLDFGTASMALITNNIPRSHSVKIEH